MSFPTTPLIPLLIRVPPSLFCFGLRELALLGLGHEGHAAQLPVEGVLLGLEEHAEDEVPVRGDNGGTEGNVYCV